MYKAYLTLTAIFCCSMLHAQNVGINTSTPHASTMLDVSASNKGVSFPNVALTSETDATTIPSPKPGLMVYNTNATLPCGTGLYFNDGSLTTPVWTCFTKTVRNFHAFDTAGRPAVNTLSVLLQPGCSISFVVPTGQTADIKIDAVLGAIADGPAGTRATLDAILYFDGAILPKGAWGRITINASTYGALSLTSFLTNVASGSHTLELRSAMNSTTGSTLNIGGNCSTAINCGELHAQVFYK